MDIIVQVDLKDLDLAEEISAYYDEDGDRRGGKTLAEAVVAALVAQAAKGDYYAGLKTRVKEIRDEEIRAAIAPIVADAVDTPLVSTNSFGEPTGKTTTLRELIMQETRKALGARNGDYVSSGTFDRSPMLTTLIKRGVDEALKAEIADAVKAAREAVTAQIGGSISDVVTEAVRTGLRAAAS